jgi:hypothetical protein
MSRRNQLTILSCIFWPEIGFAHSFEFLDPPLGGLLSIAVSILYALVFEAFQSKRYFPTLTWVSLILLWAVASTIIGFISLNFEMLNIAKHQTLFWLLYAGVPLISVVFILFKRLSSKYKD